MGTDHRTYASRRTLPSPEVPGWSIRGNTFAAADCESLGQQEEASIDACVTVCKAIFACTAFNYDDDGSKCLFLACASGTNPTGYQQVQTR
eukprot:6199575-Pleurochrysis_carterae.AAC.2